MRVEIVIDELVLNGVDARDRHRIADALQRELTHIAGADPHRWRHARAGDVLRAAECTVPPRGGGSRAAELGAQLAGAVAAIVAAPGAEAAQVPASPSASPPAHRRTWRPASAGFRRSDLRGRP
jgi:hypothetical protein